jgi:hypothetical protein
MQAIRTAATAAIALSLAACSGISVRSDYNPQADFSKYTTYAWLPAPQTGNPRTDNAIIEGRIKSGVDAALAAKGYKLGTEANANFWVGYHLNIEGQMDVTTVNSYYGYGWGRGYYGGYGAVGYPSTSVRYYDQGTLLIDVVDAQAKELVWRGTGEAEVRPDMRPEDRERRLNEAIAKILERFPPK